MKINKKKYDKKKKKGETTLLIETNQIIRKIFFN